MAPRVSDLFRAVFACQKRFIALGCLGRRGTIASLEVSPEEAFVLLGLALGATKAVESIMANPDSSAKPRHEEVGGSTQLDAIPQDDQGNFAG